MTGVLDWRELAPPQDAHWCDCEHCDLKGALEPIEWLLLVPMDVDGVDYVTDRFMMVRADLAPIPNDYEGHVHPPSVPPARGFIDAAVTTTPADGLLFPRHVLKGVRLGGWRLRLLAPYMEARSENKARASTPAVAVVTTAGEHVGWAMSSRGPESDARQAYREADQ